MKFIFIYIYIFIYIKGGKKEKRKKKRINPKFPYLDNNLAKIPSKSTILKLYQQKNMSKSISQQDQKVVSRLHMQLSPKMSRQAHHEQERRPRASQARTNKQCIIRIIRIPLT